MRHLSMVVPAIEEVETNQTQAPLDLLGGNSPAGVGNPPIVYTVKNGTQRV